MFDFLSKISQALSPAAQPGAGATSVAQDLMERAEADAGRNPRQAQELRRAACAFLSVVR